MFRWLILTLISYLLAHWADLSTGATTLADWAQMVRVCSPHSPTSVGRMPSIIDLHLPIATLTPTTGN